MSGKDLGTYFLRVELMDGRGWISTWHTGWRYTHGTPEETRLDAKPIAPIWENEEDLFDSMRFMFLEGNFSCDCNKVPFLARAYQQEEPDDPPCGETMVIKRLTAIRPDRTEALLHEEVVQ